MESVEVVVHLVRREAKGKRGWKGKEGGEKGRGTEAVKGMHELVFLEVIIETLDSFS